MAQLGGVLRCLADLAPGGRDRWDVTEGDFAWLGGRAAVFAVVDDRDDPTPPGTEPVTSAAAPVAAPGLARLARLDALHGGGQILRLGWVYLVGPVPIDGEVRRVVLPLVERHVLVRPSSFGARRGREGRFSIHPGGAWDISPLVADDALAAELERTVELGGEALSLSGIPGRRDMAERMVGRMGPLQAWVGAVVAAMGAPGATVVGPDDPRQLTDLDRPRAVVGFGVHSALDVNRLDLPASLGVWSSLPVAGTALDHVYGAAARRPGAAPTAGPSDVAPAAAEEVGATSPVRLTRAQAQVVVRARSTPVTVVSGPPGTGKTHTAVAVALDAVARGETVLMATRSTEAADVLAAHLEREPGPDPVLFGGSTRARRLARVLAEGLAQPGDPEVAARAQQAAAWEREVAAAVDRTLGGLDVWARYQLVAAEVPAHRAVAPDWFGEGVDLDRAAAVLQRAVARRDGWGWWARRAARRARSDAGAPPSTSLERLGEALAAARLRRAVAGVVPQVGEGRWAELARAEDRRRATAASALAEAVRGRVDAEHTRAVAALATALRAGRGQRRRHLASVDGRWLAEALPLWVGTLGDIETLLPQQPAMFDLVVLDEASQIDQPAAAVGLVRGRRAVVIGDPQQLRHVSFVPDRDQEGAVARHGVAELADRLDVRRVSAFDLAAGAAPVTLLDEHFRGPPHLIEFSARRFYRGRLTVATRHPATDATSCIEVRSVGGDRDASGVNSAEVAAALDVLSEVAATAAAGSGPVPSLGLATPFRAQADALLAAVGDAWSSEDIERFRLRVGTVHAFQGDERDVVVVSLGVGPDGAGLRFVEDPHLFNVLITRARRRMVVLSSCPAPRPGLLADFLAWAARPPARPDPAVAGPVDPWVASVAAALDAGGVAAHVGYPVGRETVDLVVGEGAAAVGVEMAVHPEGPAAHRRRHLRLRHAGWRLAEAFPAGHDGDPYAAAVEVATMVGTPLARTR